MKTPENNQHKEQLSNMLYHYVANSLSKKRNPDHILVLFEDIPKLKSHQSLIKEALDMLVEDNFLIEAVDKRDKPGYLTNTALMVLMNIYLSKSTLISAVYIKEMLYQNLGINIREDVLDELLYQYSRSGNLNFKLVDYAYPRLFLFSRSTVEEG